VNIKENFKTLLEGLDTSALRDKLLETPESAWNFNPYRQKEHPEAFKGTQSIILRFNGPDEPCGDVPHKTRVYEQEEAEWAPLVAPLVSLVKELYPRNIVNRCMLAKIGAGKGVQEHKDGGISLRVSHRVHIPIITSPGVIMHVGGEPLNMLEGFAYEINNTRLHSVHNGSKTDRIHLIFDMYCY
jgi:hypothetical protein